MNVITPEVISSFNIYDFMDYRLVNRAYRLVNSKSVKLVEFRIDEAVCSVSDKDNDFTVLIHLVDKKKFVFHCTCPEFDPVHLCIHVPASLIELNNFLFTKAHETWQYRLATMLQAPKYTAPVTTASRYAIIFILSRSRIAHSIRYELSPYQLKASNWPSMEQYQTTDDLNSALENEHEWHRNLAMIFQQVSPEACVNLPAEGVGLVNLFHVISRYGIETNSYFRYLPVLKSMNVPLFLREGGKILKRISISDSKIELGVSLDRRPGEYSLQAGITINNQFHPFDNEFVNVVSQKPAWVLAENILAPISNPDGLPLVDNLPVTIPETQADFFRDDFLSYFAERYPLYGNAVNWEDVSGDGVPRLYLKDDDGVLRASLCFAYGDYEVPISLQPRPTSQVNIPGSWTIIRIQRQPENEFNFYQMLTDSLFGLKRAARNFPPGTYELRAKIHPFDFLVNKIPLLTRAGFEIFGEEKLKSGKINRSIPKISLSITSGIDWFDINAVVTYGDQQVSFRDVYKALRKKEKYIKLADGSIGQIPDQWLERYRYLFELAKENPDGKSLRISGYQLPLVDILLDDAQEKQIPKDFQEARKRLASFERIDEKPVSPGFTGSLRQYQKAGVDWLHFLHDYGLGGCLADDMGLGKTIQVLALLQSLKDQQAGSPKKLNQASLLVVPKSLITNWQREAARFTPDLSIMEYLGQTRLKDTSNFQSVDVVITTYGTMLRDIQLLHSYQFNYVILDESQAIKNPLAQSSKAARLLKGTHRLVMTGTPVENNTFELWSQFAFLNPGLLGSLEFFKREFANRIESEHDEDTARLLRKLVHPFILRRTKEQVAPELPLRTERVIYTDMEPNQRKLYLQTRDRYRGMLLGLLESEGIDNIRMKILEGLLRLRQISIHPALVDPGYRGEAPKFELLFEILQTLMDENHKALVFSQFIETLRMVRKHLDDSHISYTYLDGQTRDRQDVVDRFQNDPDVRFFLISLKAGGVGLNLTAADYVIHLDPWWNPAVEMQASDRAHRIGQDKPVFIYKIIARDTVEEKILQLQERKRALVEQLISTEESFFKSLTADDIKNLFG